MNGRIALGFVLALFACEQTSRNPAAEDTDRANGTRTRFPRTATIHVSTRYPADEESGLTSRLLDTAATGAFYVGDTLYMDAFALRDAVAPSATIVQRGGVLYVNDSLFGPAKAMLRRVTLVDAKQLARRFGAYIHTATEPEYGHATIYPREILLFLVRNREHQDRVAVLVGARAEGLLPPLAAPRRD